MSAPVRAVIDTNVVVSAFVFRTGRLAWLRAAIADRSVPPIVSDESLGELLRLLAYPKLGLDAGDREAVLVHFIEHAETMKQPRIRTKLPKCRDPHDEMFLRLAYAAKANAILTGDTDLARLAGESRIPILTPAEFARTLETRPTR